MRGGVILILWTECGGWSSSLSQIIIILLHPFILLGWFIFNQIFKHQSPWLFQHEFSSSPPPLLISCDLFRTPLVVFVADLFYFLSSFLLLPFQLMKECPHHSNQKGPESSTSFNRISAGAERDYEHCWVKPFIPRSVPHFPFHVLKVFRVEKLMLNIFMMA